MSSTPISFANRNGIKPPTSPKPGTFMAGRTARNYTDKTIFNEIIEATQEPNVADSIKALSDSDLKLKKQSKKTAKRDEFIRFTVPPIKQQGGSAYQLKFKLPLGNQEPAAFVQNSVMRAEQIAIALHENNIVEQPTEGILHNPYINPNFINHKNGSLEKYVAAKKAFANSRVLPTLPKGVGVEMLADGSIRIRINERHKKHNETEALPKILRTAAQGDAVIQQEQRIIEFVNERIRRAASLTVGFGLPLSGGNVAPGGTVQTERDDVTVVSNQGGLTSASARPLNTHHISDDEAFARQLHAQELAENDTSADAEFAQRLHEEEQARAASLQQTQSTARAGSKTPVFDELLDDSVEEEKQDVASSTERQQATTAVVQNRQHSKPPAPPRSTKSAHLSENPGLQQSSRTVVGNTATSQTTEKPPALPPRKSQAGSLPITQQSSNTIDGNKKPAVPPPPPRREGQTQVPTVVGRPIQTQADQELPLAQAKTAASQVPGRFTAEAEERATNARKRIIGNDPKQSQPTDPFSMQGALATAAVKNGQGNLRKTGGNGTSAQQTVPQPKAYPADYNPFNELDNT